MKPFHEQLSEARKAAGYTQEKLAEQLNVSRQSISSWERNNSQPDLETIRLLSSLLNFEFTLVTAEESAAEPGASESSAPAKKTQAQAKLKRLAPCLISFIAGVLAALMVVFWIAPMFEKPAEPGFTTVNNEKGSKTGPDTVYWFTETESPREGKPYVRITFSENPIYARKNPDFVDGAGWKYTVYLTEYNNKEFFPETYTMYYFRDEDTAVTTEYSAMEMESWWGEARIGPRGQQCVSSGDPLQNIIGIGIKLTGRDAEGEEMSFYGYMECKQEIKE